MMSNVDPEGVILEKLLTSAAGSSNRQRRHSDEDSVCTIDLGRKSSKRNDKEELDFELNESWKKPRIDIDLTSTSETQETSFNGSPFLNLNLKDDEKENIGPLSPVLDDVYEDDIMEDDIPMPEVRHRQVLRLIPQVPYISVATYDGTRVYLRLKSEKDMSDEGKNKFDKPKRNLLGVNFYDLKKEATDKLKEFQASISSQIVENEKDKEIKSQSVKDVEDGKNLWVDKYRPKAYLDLISEESMNRNLLHWIKLFDKTVFGRDYLAKVKATKEKYAQLELMEKEREKYNKNKIVVEDDGYDPTGRPKQKFALLHGPPGLGKTTAAHIIAKHAGYNVIEMNASDDRSMEIFKRMLDSATESRSEYFNHGKPNCLIIDEIDGAPQATVNLLVDLISGKSIEKGKSKTPKILKRPIICICNDLFAPSLKNLRKLGFILEFQPVAMSNLIERLEEITLKEKFTIDSGTLRELAEKTECDVRSCLSSLQFIKRAKSNKTNINTAKLLNQIGKMDKNKGIFSIWSSIFIQPTGKRYYDSGDHTSSEKRFQNVLKTAQNFGEYEKVAAGVFENYLRVKFRDSYFRNIIEGLNWMIWFEEIRGHVERSQNYTMFGYMPCFFVVSHFLFSSKNWVKLQYPNSEILSRSNKIASLVKTQLGELNPYLGKFLDISGLLLDVFPYLLSIIQPDTIRPVPTQLWSSQERGTIKNIVELMIHYNLNYVQNRTQEGSYAYMLEPDLDVISRFNNLESGNNKKIFPYTIKQLVAREIETEKLKRNDGEGEIESVVASSVAINHLHVDAANPRSPSSISDWIKKSSESKRKITDDSKITVTKDFFGRTIVPSPRSTAIQEAKRKKDEKFDIWYRYKEGFSNAVRKNLKVKDFV